jgi:meso-butanediol dehydrogenase/(S,S)-butanediol dehydrogenase/diacetyl reductase
MEWIEKDRGKHPMGRLAGRIAIVTGAGRGIGKGVAIRFAREGAKVGVVDLVDEMAKVTAGEIVKKGGEAIAFHANVALSNDIDRFVTKVTEVFRRIDIVVNNAGMGGSKTCTETSEEGWDQMLTVNLKSMFLVCKRVIPEMLKVGGGKIINIASIFGMAGAPQTLAYSVAKSGVINLTRQLAVDYSPHHINVNSISPGLIQTEMTRTKLEDPARKEYLTKLIPLRRLGLPADIAASALFLASEDSDFITGHNLVVDGGQTIRVE